CPIPSIRQFHEEPSAGGGSGWAEGRDRTAPPPESMARPACPGRRRTTIPPMPLIPCRTRDRLLHADHGPESSHPAELERVARSNRAAQEVPVRSSGLPKPVIHRLDHAEEQRTIRRGSPARQRALGDRRVLRRSGVKVVESDPGGL